MIAHEYKSQLRDEPHPEQLPSHRLDHDCEHVHGYPQCMGAAAMDAGHCTCSFLTQEQHERCEREGAAAAEARAGDMCADCAFRKGSPEEDDQERIAAQVEPFHCHQGMPVRTIGGVPQKDSYRPRNVKLYPVCAGWLRAREALLRRNGA
jgi:hypothetical protein